MNPPAQYEPQANDSPGPVKGMREQRRFNRVREAFPGLLVPAAGRLGRGRKAVPATTRDYDVEGVCLTTDRPMAVGEAVRLQLRLPRSLSRFFKGLACALPARVRTVRPAAQGRGFEVVLRWDRPLPALVERAVTSYQRRIGIAIAILLVFAVWFKWRSLVYFWYTPFFFIYSLTLLTYLLSRFLISWRHRVPPLGRYTPPISVVIAVRNEEKAIARTVESCFKADYPSERREVIVVDDGSTDATPRELEALRRRFAKLRVHTLKPSGKRFAMAEGVRRAAGEIIVFLDSDTYVHEDSLRRIVCGFEDPTLGASAGYAEVDNADKNLLTGLQEVRYVVSFRLFKAAESFFSCVTCASGCLAAYRREYILEFLDPWLKQTFLGRPATFGDDRSLTNFILRKYRVIYNDLATASTLVPETWKHYLLQQARWKKSWLRETWIASGFMYKKHPIAAISFYSAALFSLLSPLMVVRVLYLELQGRDAIFLYYALGLLLVALLQSLYYLFKKPKSNWVLGLMWMASSLLITGPQTYYAMLTIRKNHWGTR
ncbi:MAG: glycosyltransferase [Elusimicrobia bacterium]|nr:glycosyltransferase [Elusimicrobiota bacterium]